MLFKALHLKGIKSGEITLAFRKWKKASVKAGSRMHSPIGVIEIRGIEPVDESEITDHDALRAGFNDRIKLLESLSLKNPGTIFRISVSYHSEDPRINLREQTALSEQQFTDLKQKLESLDKNSKHGPWTMRVLLTIKENPGLHAVGISNLTGLEKEWLKLNIRKMKNLGLTISHLIGYEISPLGKVFIDKSVAEK